jgi:hypothetical protein
LLQIDNIGVPLLQIDDIGVPLLQSDNIGVPLLQIDNIGIIFKFFYFFFALRPFFSIVVSLQSH